MTMEQLVEDLKVARDREKALYAEERERTAALANKRDELLAALREVDTALNGVQPGHGERANALADRLRPVVRAAITKATA